MKKNKSFEIKFSKKAKANITKTLNAMDVRSGLEKKKRQLERKLKTKLSKLDRKRAMKYINHIDFKLRKMKGVSAKVQKHNELLKAGQMQLPNFLRQMSTVRMEELVAAKLAQLIHDEMKAASKTSRNVSKGVLKAFKRAS